jgi:tetratricopeptide (TPR) repeat protein
VNTFYSSTFKLIINYYKVIILVLFTRCYKNIITLLLLHLCYNGVQALNVDSVLAVANKLPKGDSMRIIYLCDASYYLHYANVNDAYKLALNTQAEVEQYKHVAGKYKILTTLGTIEQTRSNYDNSIKQFKLAEQHAQAYNKPKWLETIYNNLANTYNLLTDPVNAIKYYEKSIAAAKQHDKGLWGSAYLNIAALYAKSNNTQFAINNCMLAMQDTKRLPIATQVCL